MADLNSILNWTVPVIIVLVFFGILYTKMKEPIDQVFRWIGRLFKLGTSKITENKPEFTTVYRYG